MIRTWRRAGAAVVAASAMLLTACSGGGGVAGGGAASEGASGDPVQGGSATILMLSEGRSLDPALGSNNNNGMAPAGNGIFGTLLTTDPETGEITPSLASSFATADGGKTFELTLRDGLKFSDGSPFEASAVKAHWDRVKDPATGSAYQADASFVESSEVTSPTTLRATMVAPVPNYGYSIVTSVLNWVPKPEAIAAGAAAFDDAPIGAGPYTLKEWRRQDALVLVRNPLFWDAPRPYLDEITLRGVTDLAQRLNNLVSGGADLSLESSWTNTKKARESNLAVLTQPLSGGNYIALNTRRAPFDDVRARQALALALDPVAMNASVFDGDAELVDTFFSPSSPLFVDDTTPTPDKAAAQALFDELAAEGRPVTFTFLGIANVESRATGEAIQTQLGAFTNVTVKVDLVDFAAIPAVVAAKDFEATVSSVAFLDPEPRVSTAFQGGSPGNMSGIDDPEINAALLQGRVGTTLEERKAAYETVQQRLEALVPNVWVARNNSSVVSTKQVGGVNLYGFGSLSPEKLWIQP